MGQSTLANMHQCKYTRSFSGYKSFTGLYGTGLYKNTPIGKKLPVAMLQTSYMVEVTEGLLPKSSQKTRPILQGVTEKLEGGFCFTID